MELLNGPPPAFVACMPRAGGRRSEWRGVCHDLRGKPAHPRDRTGEKLLQPYVTANRHGLDLVVIVCDAGKDDPADVCRELRTAANDGRLYAARTAVGAPQPGIEAWLLGHSALPGRDEQDVKAQLRTTIGGDSTRDYRQRAEEIDVAKLFAQEGPFKEMALQIAAILGLQLPAEPTPP
ncbi:MAG: hypothetical protein HY907_15820 [Deltaproteobacteria bacterium]|nr:hypothetical protein [Deltaproteobacteria bacterium]